MVFVAWHAYKIADAGSHDLHRERVVGIIGHNNGIGAAPSNCVDPVGWSLPIELNNYAGVVTPSEWAGEPRIAATVAGQVYVVWAQSTSVGDQIFAFHADASQASDSVAPVVTPTVQVSSPTSPDCSSPADVGFGPATAPEIFVNPSSGATESLRVVYMQASGSATAKPRPRLASLLFRPGAVGGPVLQLQSDVQVAPTGAAAATEGHVVYSTQVGIGVVVWTEAGLKDLRYAAFLPSSTGCPQVPNFFVSGSFSAGTSIESKGNLSLGLSAAGAIASYALFDVLATGAYRVGASLVKFAGGTTNAIVDTGPAARGFEPHPSLNSSSSSDDVYLSYALCSGSDPRMQPDIYLAGSTDSGQSWPGALTELVSDLASQSDERSDYPSLFVARASNDDIAHIVWDDRRNWTELTDSIDNPPTSSPDVAGAPEVYHQNIIR